MNENRPENPLERLRILQALCNSQEFVCYVPFIDDTDECIQAYHIDDSFRKMFPELNEQIPFYECLARFRKNIVHPDDLSAFDMLSDRKQLRRSLEDSASVTLETRLLTEGLYRYYHCTVTAVRTFDGILEGILLTLQKSERNPEKEQNYAAAAALASGYNAIYLVNLESNEYYTFSSSELVNSVLGSNLEKQDYREVLTAFVNSCVLEKDREMLLNATTAEYARENLLNSTSYTMIYRSIYKGTVEYCQMRVVRVGNDPENITHVVLAFANRNKEIMHSLVSEKLSEEFWSIFSVNLDSDSITTIKGNYLSGEDVVWPSRFTEYIRASSKKLEADSQLSWQVFQDINFTRYFLKEEDTKYVILCMKDRRWIRAKFSVISRVDNDVQDFLLAFAPLDRHTSEVFSLRSIIKEQNDELTTYNRLSHSNTWKASFNSYGKIVDVSWSDEFYKNLGYIKGVDFSDTVESWHNHVHPEDLNRVVTFFHNAYKDPEWNRKNQHGELYVEYRMIHKDGSYRWFASSGMFKRHEDFPPHMAFGIMIDITDTKEKQQMQLKLEEALKAAEVANKSKSTFLFNMSHDIRTPMNAITGYTLMARNHVDDPERISSYLEKISLSSDRLLSLINQVLEMSRIESGKVLLKEKSADFYEQVTITETIYVEQASMKGITFRTHIKNLSHPYVITATDRIEQITSNLIGNALKYTLSGGFIDYTVEEMPDSREGWSRYVFTFQDTGIGMSPEFLEHIFEEFSREETSTVNNIQGTGLGMSIVKRLVDLLDGTIEISSVKGKGSVFTVTIPMQWDMNPPKREKEETQAQKGSLRGLRILLVEDNEMNREIASEILGELGILVTTAVDGQDAVQKVRTARHGELDLVLMDIQMPRMNGYEATKAIRELDDGILSQIPIVAMTANTFDEDIQNAREAGMNGHVSKPINIKQLVSTLSMFR